jgi:hypothetical protein
MRSKRFNLRWLRRDRGKRPEVSQPVAPAGEHAADVTQPSEVHTAAKRTATAFISYSHEDAPFVAELSQFLREREYAVWFDQDLTGGWNWWQTILDKIVTADLVISVISEAQLRSKACQLEVKYALELKRTILPIIANDISVYSLDTYLQSIQAIDMRERDAISWQQLAHTLSNLPTPQPLPDPLPDQPEPPLSPLGDIRRLIASHALSYEEQAVLLLRLKELVQDPKTAEAARQVLAEFRAQVWIAQLVADEIDSMLTPHRPHHLSATEHVSLAISASPTIETRESDFDGDGAYFTTERHEDRISIVPHIAYVDLFRAGGPITPSGPKWEFPTLDFKMANNTGRTILITDAIFHVQESALIAEPLFGISGIGPYSPVGMLDISNFSPQELTNVQVMLNVISREQADAVNQSKDFDALATLLQSPELYRGPYAHVYPVGAVKDTVALDISSAVLGQPSVSFDATVIYGAIAFSSLAGEERQVTFWCHIRIVPDQSLYRLLGPPQHKYNARLQSIGKDYQVNVPLSQFLKDTDVDWFQITLAAKHSSHHQLRVELLLSDNSSIVSSPVEVAIIAPNGEGVSYAPLDSLKVLDPSPIDASEWRESGRGT